jgi:uncharacterized protein involved in type VI secretion and phage assembly
MSEDINGPVYATVSDSKDPEKMGRVKVSFEMLGDSMVSGWLPVLNIFGGTFYIPEVGSQVIVAFINGSTEQGLVLGNVWSSAQKPPASGENPGMDFNQDGKNSLRYLTTKSGNKVILDDKGGNERIQFINANGTNRLEFIAKKKLIKIKSKKKVTLKAGKNLTLKAKKTNMKFTKQLTIEGQDILIQSRDSLTLESAKEQKVKGLSVAIN